MKKERKVLKLFFFCFFLATVFLFFCSKNSPFYPFNDWVDANAFFTVGKSMVRGVVPYLELFEQKGPLLYFIYGVASLISNNTFIGVYLLEIISWTIFLFFTAKTIKLFVEDKYVYWILPLFTVILMTTHAFTHGGSAEEFCLPFLATSAYYLLRHYKNDYPNNMKDFHLFLNGLIAGCIAMIKYTILGFWFGFMVSLLWVLFKKKDFKEIIRSSLIFLCGMAIPILCFGFYFLLNNGLYDFFYQYVLVNITAYPKSHSFIIGLIIGFGNFIYQCFTNLWVALFMCFGTYYVIGKNTYFKNVEVRNLLKVVLFFSVLFIYATGLAFHYYFYVLSFFAIFGFIAIVDIIDKKKIAFLENKFKIISLAIIVVSAGLLFTSPNYSFSKNKKEDLAQYVFANIIKETPNATILNYGFLDGGFYTTTNIIPNVKYFMKQNIDYEVFPDIIDGQDDAVRNRKVDYIIVSKDFGRETIHFDMQTIVRNYKLIKVQKQLYEKGTRTYLLYQKKEV